MKIDPPSEPISLGLLGDVGGDQRREAPDARRRLRGDGEPLGQGERPRLAGVDERHAELGGTRLEARAQLVPGQARRAQVQRLLVRVARVEEQEHRGLGAGAHPLLGLRQGRLQRGRVAAQHQEEVVRRHPAQLAQRLGHSLGVGAGEAQLHLPGRAEVVAGHYRDAATERRCRGRRAPQRDGDGDGDGRSQRLSGSGCGAGQGAGLPGE
ncbi:MAG: hypothetical protein QM765_46880 [Myxococcales bacterium]